MFAILISILASITFAIFYNLYLHCKFYKTRHLILDKKYLTSLYSSAHVKSNDKEISIENVTFHPDDFKLNNINWERINL